MAIANLFFTRTRSFFYGLLLPVDAAKLIFSRRTLLVWSTIPIGLTLTLYFYLIRWLESASREALSHYIAGIGWSPDGWAAAVLLFFTRILMIVVAAMTFSLTSSIVASPFNDWLAESAEPWTTPPLPAPAVPSDWRRNWGFKLRLVGIDVLKSLAAFGGMILALILAWIPVVNSISFIAAFLLITFQYVSYPQTRRGQGLGDGFRFLWKYAFACTGLGTTLSLLFAVPVLSSLALPIAVVSGTLLYARAQVPRIGDTKDLFVLK